MKGIIYKITGEKDGKKEVYIGSTKTDLKERWQEHKDDYKRYVKKGGKKARSLYLFQKYGIQNCKMELIKEYEVVDTRHLRVYESLFFSIYKRQKICVNILEPSGLIKNIKWLCKKRHQLRRINKKDILKDYKKKVDKEYYERNKAKINEKVKCDICGLTMNKSSLIRHKRNIHGMRF